MRRCLSNHTLDEEEKQLLAFMGKPLRVSEQMKDPSPSLRVDGHGPLTSLVVLPCPTGSDCFWKLPQCYSTAVIKQPLLGFCILVIV